MNPYIDIYALVDDDGETVLKIQKTKFTAWEIEELEKEFNRHLRLGVVVLDPYLIESLPLRPEVFTEDARAMKSALERLKKDVLGRFITVKEQLGDGKYFSNTFLIIRASLNASTSWLWGYTCKGTRPLQCYSCRIDTKALLELTVTKKVTTELERPGFKVRTTYTLTDD